MWINGISCLHETHMKKSGMWSTMRGRQWFDVYGAARRPLESSDAIPHVSSAAEIPDMGYIPHVPHKQRTVY
jgi:hypothetical protein